MEDVGENIGDGSHFLPIVCSALCKDGFVMMEGRPCKIVDMNTLQRESKVQLVGLDIFTNAKYEATFKSTQYVDVPNVRRCDFELVGITNDGFVSIMNDKGEIRDDLRLPEGELATKIRDEVAKSNAVMVTVLSAAGEEAIIACNRTN